MGGRGKREGVVYFHRERETKEGKEKESRKRKKRREYVCIEWKGRDQIW